MKTNNTMKRRTFFKSRTFASKLFLKLTNGYINPEIACVSILSFESQNRTRSDIEKTIPWLMTLNDLTDFLFLNEDPNDYKQILFQFALILFYQYARQFHIVKRLGEKKNFFYVVMNGSLSQLELEYSKESLTDEEYLIHLIKLSILQENELFNKIKQTNSDLFKMKEETIEEYCRNSHKYLYCNLYNKALQLLKKYNIDIIRKKGLVPSIQDYISMTRVESEQEKIALNMLTLYNNNLKTNKKMFLIPHFIQSKLLSTSNFFGNLLINNQNEQNDYVYIANESSDLGYINKAELNSSNIFIIIAQKMKAIFKEKQKLFYIFSGIPKNLFVNTYSNFMSYKKYKKGDKLLLQNTEYKGVFLLQKGELEVYTFRSFDELDGLMVSLQQSLEGFNEYISSLKDAEIPLENLSNLFNNPVYQTNQFLSASKEKRKINMLNINNKEVVGLNELYYFKTQIINFTIECLSDEAIVYFIPKEAFRFLLNKETTVNNYVIQLVETKVKLYIQMIRRYKETFVKEISKKVGNKYPVNPISNNNHHSNIRLKTLNSTNFGDFHPAKRFSTQEISSNFNTTTTIRKKYSINCETPTFIQNQSLYLQTTVGDENEQLRTIQKKRSFRIQNTQYQSDFLSKTSLTKLPPLTRKVYKSSKTLTFYSPLNIK